MERETPLAKGQFYIKNFILYDALNGNSLDVDLGKWKLEIDGLVNKKLAFSYDELNNMEHLKYSLDFNCVTKWSIKNVLWEGPSLKKILEMAEVKKEAKFAIFYCLDGYTVPINLEDITADSIIALRLNGEVLKKQQGFPARPFIPSLYGWKSAKWLKLIFLVKDYKDGYWERYGYHARGRWANQERFESDIWKRIKKTVIS
jgi:DMSO/TMAO reductase YedYZ molybdopterin-dependent catalytic subunit